MEQEENVETQETQSEEKPASFLSRILLYAVVPMWSFFFVFFVLYFVIVKNYSQPPKMAQTDQSLFIPKFEFPDTLSRDSLISKYLAGAWDSLFMNDLLTVDDKLRILKVENHRRQKEIDYLYGQVVMLQKKFDELVAIASEMTPQKYVQVLMEQFPNLQLVPPDTTEEPQAPTEEGEPPPEDTGPDPAIVASAKIYASMRPGVAAKILAGIEEAMAADILANTNQRKAAKILESMDPDKAMRLSQLMIESKRKK